MESMEMSAPSSRSSVVPSGVSALQTEGPIYMVANNSSRSGARDERAEKIQQTIEAEGRTVHWIDPQSPENLNRAVGEAAQAAHENDGIVVVAGGDGTINAALSPVLALDCALAILPSGTFNYVARSYGIPEELDDALQVLLFGQEERVDVGLVNGRPFMVNASLGLYPELLEEREEVQHRWGRQRAVAAVSGIFSLLKRHKHLHLEFQNSQQGHHKDTVHRLRTTSLFVAKNRLQLDVVGSDLAESVEEGHLVAMALRETDVVGRVGAALRTFLSGVEAVPELLSFAFEDLTVRTSGPSNLKVALDGEITTIAQPLRFESLPKRLRLIVPREKSGESA